MKFLKTNEKRTNLRIPCSQPVIIKENTADSLGTMTDFSKYGLGFILSRKVDIEKTIEINFSIPINNKYQSFTFKAKVQHCIDYYEQNHIGVLLNIEGDKYNNLVNQIVAA